MHLQSNILETVPTNIIEKMSFPKAIIRILIASLVQLALCLNLPHVGMHLSCLSKIGIHLQIRKNRILAEDILR